MKMTNSSLGLSCLGGALFFGAIGLCMSPWTLRNDNPGVTVAMGVLLGSVAGIYVAISFEKVAHGVLGILFPGKLDSIQKERDGNPLAYGMRLARFVGIAIFVPGGVILSMAIVLCAAVATLLLDGKEIALSGIYDDLNSVFWWTGLYLCASLIVAGLSYTCELFFACAKGSNRRAQQSMATRKIE